MNVRERAQRRETTMAFASGRKASRVTSTSLPSSTSSRPPHHLHGRHAHAPAWQGRHAPVRGKDRRRQGADPLILSMTSDKKTYIETNLAEGDALENGIREAIKKEAEQARDAEG